MKSEWLDYPRTKTGIRRRIPLWPETAAAICQVLAERREPNAPVVFFDCHKAASKWMLVDFYGKVLVEPTRVVHTRPALETTICHIRRVIEQCRLKDLVVAIERTGNYHLVVKRSFDRAGFDTRVVHPFATKHYRSPADEGNKTDDTDLDAIFRASLAGYGLVEQELGEPYVSLRLLARHRRDLVGKRLSALLLRTPYVLLLSHPGVNVVSAAELAGEMGPIEHYPRAKSITGRAGIYPSRYQSDDVASLKPPRRNNSAEQKLAR